MCESSGKDYSDLFELWSVTWIELLEKLKRMIVIGASLELSSKYYQLSSNNELYLELKVSLIIQNTYVIAESLLSKHR